MNSTFNFTTQAVALANTGIDTDQIIPARFLSRLDRTGYEDALFFEKRKDPNFALNKSSALKAEILVTGRDFGIGSSREHAVWGLLDWGFKAVFSSSFGDIFRTNAGECGLLCGVISEDDASRLINLITDDPLSLFTVDIEQNAISVGEESFSFEITGRTRNLLFNGGDAIQQTLANEESITRFEFQRSKHKPTISRGTDPRLVDT